MNHQGVIDVSCSDDSVIQSALCLQYLCGEVVLLSYNDVSV